MNRYATGCITAGAVIGAVLGLSGVVEIAGFPFGRAISAVALTLIGAVVGYAASALRISTDPVHPNAKPRDRHTEASSAEKRKRPKGEGAA